MKPTRVELYMADCHARFLLDEQKPGGVDACGTEPRAPKIEGDPPGCDARMQACSQTCAETCDGCEERCGNTCDTCKAGCAGDEACIRQCAAVRSTCSSDCTRPAAVCHGTCLTSRSGCWTVWERKMETACGRALCRALESCKVDCAQKFGSVMPECRAWCSR